MRRSMKAESDQQNVVAGHEAVRRNKVVKVRCDGREQKIKEALHM